VNTFYYRDTVDVVIFVPHHAVHVRMFVQLDRTEGRQLRVLFVARHGLMLLAQRHHYMNNSTIM
jgi:hypothetical protein